MQREQEIYNNNTIPNNQKSSPKTDSQMRKISKNKSNQ